MTRTLLARESVAEPAATQPRRRRQAPAPASDQDRLGAQGAYEAGIDLAPPEDIWTELAVAVAAILERADRGEVAGEVGDAGAAPATVETLPTGLRSPATTLEPVDAEEPAAVPEATVADEAETGEEGEIVEPLNAAAAREESIAENGAAGDVSKAQAPAPARAPEVPPEPPRGSARAIARRWSGGVRARAQAIPRPELSPEQEKAERLRAIGAAGRERSEEVQATATREALSQVAPAPQPDERPPAPPPGNPVPTHTERILSLSNKRLENMGARPLTLSSAIELEGLVIGGTLPRLTDQPIDPVKFNLLTATGEIGALAGEPMAGSDDARQMAAALRVLTMTEADLDLQTAAMMEIGRGPAVITRDEGARLPAPLPPEQQAPVGQVVARLLAQKDETVEGILDNLRQLAFPDGILKARFPDIGSGMAADLATSVQTDLEDIASAADITAAELDQAIADRRAELGLQAEQANAAVSSLRTETVDELGESGQAALDAVAGAADAADEETLRRQEAASGGADPEVINRRRDRTVNWIRSHVTDQITAYQQVGDRRLTQLRKAKTQQKNGYTTRSQREIFAVLRPEMQPVRGSAVRRPARDPSDTVREAMLTRVVTRIRAETREQTTAVDNHFDPLIRTARETTQSYRSDIETAGSAGIEAARSWAEDRILEGESWWTRFWTRVQRWFEEADDVNERWRVRRTTEMRDGVDRDLQVADRVAEALAADVSQQEILRSAAISEDQRFIIRQYFALGEGAHPLDYAALSIKYQLSQSHRPHAREVFERELIVMPISGPDDAVIDDLVAVTSSEGASFDPRTISEGVRRAVRGWGTDEAAIYRSLANLSALQGHVVRKVYRARYNRDLDQDLRDDLSGDELDRAQQLLAGEQARADAAALHYAIAGMGTDEAAIMATLRNKTPEQVAAIEAAYFEQYGETLDDALEGDLAEGNEIDQARALMDGNTALADAIAVDEAMRGGVFGWGASAGEVEAVQTRIRQEVLALAQSEKWTSAQFEAEVRRRLAAVDEQFEGRYAHEEQYNAPGLEGESAMRRAFSSEFRGAELDLVNALQDNDPIAADAARIEIERTSFYASDDRIITILESQYERSMQAVQLDQGPARRAGLRREFHRRVAALDEPDRSDPIAHSRIRMQLQHDMEAAMEAEASARAQVSTDELERIYNREYLWPLSFVVDWHTSGDANRRAVATFEAGGRLDPLQDIELASAEGDGNAALARLSTITDADIARIRADWERRHPGRSFRSMLETSFSGRDQSDILDAYDYGRPETALETIEQERRRVRRELNDLTGVFGESAASSEAAWMQAELGRLEALEADLRSDIPDTEEGRERSLALLGEVDRRADNVQAAVGDYRHQIDSVANAVSQAIGVAIAVVVAVVVTALTLGTGVGAGVALAAAIIGSVLATGATMATKQLVKGGAYGRNEMTTDLVVGAVDLVVSVATLGIGSRLLGPVLRGMSGAAGLARAAASGAGRVVGNSGTRLAASGTGRAIGGAATRLAGTGFGRAARSGLGTVGRGVMGVGRQTAGMGRGVARFGRRGLDAITPREGALGHLMRETAERIPTSRAALASAARTTLGEGIEDAISAVPSAMVGMAMSQEAWKGDPLDNFLAGGWDAILQSVVLGRTIGAGIHLATPAIRLGRTRFLGNVSRVAEVTSYLNARYEPFARRNPGASMADFMSHPDGIAVRQEIQRRGLMDALVELSRAGPPRTDLDTAPDALPRTELQARADALADTVPPAMRDGTFVTADPALSGRSVSVEPLRIDGQIVGVDIRVGPEATPLDIALHLPTVRTMRRYRGLLGRVRNVLDTVAIGITGQGQREGSRGWEAQAELEKLPAVMAARMEALGTGRLTPEAEARIHREIDGLESQIDVNRAVLADPTLADADGRGYVAATDDSTPKGADVDAVRPDGADADARAARADEDGPELPPQLRPDWDPETMLTPEEKQSLARERAEMAAERQARIDRVEQLARGIEDLLPEMATLLHQDADALSAQVLDDMIDWLIAKGKLPRQEHDVGRRPTIKQVIEQLRGREAPLDALIPESSIAENAAAVEILRARLAEISPDKVFGVKRGGALLLEVLGVPPGADPDNYVVMPKGPNNNRTTHLEPFIRQAIENGDRSFVIVDFYMGGGAAGNFINMVKKIVKDYPDLELRFETLWIRERFGFERNYLTDDRTARAYDGVTVEKEVPAGLRGIMAQTVVHVRYLLGDDMYVVLGDQLTDVVSQESRDLPIMIFNRNGEIVQVIHVGTPHPSTGVPLDQRGIIVALMQGYRFD